MPNVYQTVFGGNVVAPAIPTFLSLPISTSVVLGWPLESNITSPAAAEIIEVTASVGGLTVQLSDARQVSTGYCALFNNIGANTFSVLDASGATLMSVASGQVWQLYIADNSTLAGTWRVFQYGAGVSSANAAALAGFGLKAITTTLNEHILLNPQAANYVIQASDRAACVEWTGGSGGTLTLPNPATVGSDWFCYIKNNGSGVVTLSPPSGTIDGSASKTYNPNDSSIILTDGTNFISLGFGQSVASSFNFVTISLAGASGTVVLTGAQLNRISYKFTGALAGNTTVQVPASIQQYWVDNETTGAFTLTISAGGAGSTFTVPQANRTILYCDGLNIVNAISSGSIQFADGTAAAPSITFASDPTLGFYKAGADVLGTSTAGVQRGTVNASGQWVFNAAASGVTLSLTAASAQSSLVISGATNSYADITLIDGNTGHRQWDLMSGFTGTGIFSIRDSSAGLTPLQISSGTGNVTINAPTAGDALTVTGLAGSEGLTVKGSASVSNSFGAQILAGTNSSDRSFGVFNQAGSLQYFAIAGNGASTFNPASGVAVSATGVSNANTVLLVGGAATSQSFGLEIDAGTNTSDAGIRVYNQTRANQYFQIRGDGALLAGLAGSGFTVANAGNVTVGVPTAGVSLTVNGVAGNNTANFQGSASAGNSFGLVVSAGTNASDRSCLFQNTSGGSQFLQIFGDGHGTLGPSAAINIFWGVNGNFTLTAPASGTAFTVNGITGSTAVGFTDGTHNGVLSLSSTAGQEIQLGSSSNHGVGLITNGTVRVTISNTGLLQAVDAGGTFQSVGWLNVPQNLQTVNYTAVLADSGKGIDMNGASLTATIPANGSVAYAIGTVLTFTNLNASNLSIAITTDTLTLAGTTTTGTRTLVQNGMATARKTAATSWIISGSGLS